MNFPVQIRQNIEVGENLAMQYIYCWHFVDFYSFNNFFFVIIFISFSVSFYPSVIEPGSIINLFFIFPSSFSKNTSKRERVSPNIAFLNFIFFILFLSIIGMAELFRLVIIP